MSQTVIPLQSILKKQSALVGKKALQLGILLKKGFTVPEGFAITTKVHKQFLRNKKLKPEVWKEIVAAYKTLPKASVAVRSSSTIEDSKSHSFAGQFETKLNVRNTKQLKKAILACYESSERLEQYLKKQGKSKRKVVIGLLVQIMVPAKYSGVMFTVHPVKGHQEMLINAHRGIGERLVSGKITPEQISVHKNEITTYKKEHDKDILGRHEIAKLAAIGHAIAKSFHAPQDIEWAFYKDHLYVLQSRPITTLKEPIKRHGNGFLGEEKKRLKEIASSNTIWASFNIAEILPEPTPLSLDIIRKIMSASGALGKSYRSFLFPVHEPKAKANYIESICGKTYINIEQENDMFFRHLPFAYPFHKLKKQPEKALYPQVSFTLRYNSWFGAILSPFYFMRYLVAQFYASRRRKKIIQNFYQEGVESLEQKIAHYKGEKLSSLPVKKLQAKMQKLVTHFTHTSSQHTIKAALINRITWQMLGDLLLRTELSEKQKELLFTPTYENETLEFHQALFELGHKKITRREFLQHFGHRALSEFEISEPRFREKPKALDSLLEVAKNPQSPLKAVEVIHTKKEKLLQKLEKQLEYQPLLLYKIQREVELLEQSMKLREDVKHYILQELEIIRRLAIAIGKKLQLKDINYLTVSEICKASSSPKWRKLIKKRKTAHEALIDISLPPVILSDEISDLEHLAFEGYDKELQGVTVCGGKVKGEIVSVHKKKDMPKDVQGKILVLPDADPIWTTIFPKAKGLIIEKGGILSHSAIIAREYGIPTIINIPNITKILKNKQQVVLDASSGKIYVQ